MSEPIECYGMKTRKARKEHKCCECHGVIQRGELYHYHHGIFDGNPVHYKVCADCEALRERVDRDVLDNYERTPFEGLCEASQNKPETKLAYIRIRIKRGAKIIVPEYGAMCEAISISNAPADLPAAAGKVQQDIQKESL